MLFRILALLLMAAFYACYFIKLLGQKKKGIKTTQIGTGKTGFVKWVECTMMVSTVLVVIAELVSIILGTTLLPPWARWLGAGIAVVGVAVFVTAVITMRDSWRAGVSKSEKTELVTSGIFSISRNPAFLGFDLVYIGVLLMFFNWVLFAVSIFAALMFHLQIVNVEEDFLLEAFGEDYLNYRKRVNRYFGKKPKKKVRLKTILKWLVIAVISLILAAILFVCVVRGITWFSNRIDTANGIDEGIYVSLGGQEQYLLIRGEDVENPVMIWLHGGPSSPDAFANYTFQKHLVDEYTIVNWDQRGCGRTYYRNRDTDPNNETASFEQAQADLDELVDYLTDRFNTDKVIIVGHSYGTMLGSKYTLEHPDKVAAYIGVGQFVDIESDIYSYEDALAIAKSRGDDTMALEAAYSKYSEDMTLVNMMNLRGLVGEYHTAEKEANTLWLGIASPYMGFDDLRWFLKQMGDFEEYVKLNQQLFDYIMVADVRDYGMEYQVPVGFISGSDDWITPVKYSEDYYNAVSAPMKDMALIDGCGHSPHYDSPEEFCDILKGMLDEFLK